MRRKKNSWDSGIKAKKRGGENFQKRNERGARVFLGASTGGAYNSSFLGIVGKLEAKKGYPP